MNSSATKSDANFLGVNFTLIDSWDINVSLNSAAYMIEDVFAAGAFISFRIFRSIGFL